MNRTDKPSTFFALPDNQNYFKLLPVCAIAGTVLLVFTDRAQFKLIKNHKCYKEKNVSFPETCVFYL